MPKYPDVKVKLAGEDGNAFFIISRVRTALRKVGVSEEELGAFTDEAMSGDYPHVIATVSEWVAVR